MPQAYRQIYDQTHAPMLQGMTHMKFHAVCRHQIRHGVPAALLRTMLTCGIKAINTCNELSQVGGCWWLMRMARDTDACTSASAWEMLALLVQPGAQPTCQMLLKACPDVATSALKVPLVV